MGDPFSYECYVSMKHTKISKGVETMPIAVSLYVSLVFRKLHIYQSLLRVVYVDMKEYATQIFMYPEND